MKNWCKIIRLKEHHVLVERIANHEDGEAIRVSCRFPEVHAVATMGFENDEIRADHAYKKFDAKGAQGFIDDFLKMMEDHEQGT